MTNQTTKVKTKITFILSYRLSKFIEVHHKLLSKVDTRLTGRPICLTVSGCRNRKRFTVLNKVNRKLGPDSGVFVLIEGEEEEEDVVLHLRRGPLRNLDEVL